MNRDDAVWGLVGGLAFLVLLSGYELATGYRAPLPVKGGVAVVVTLLAAGLAGVIGARLRENESA